MGGVKVCRGVGRKVSFFFFLPSLSHVTVTNPSVPSLVQDRLPDNRIPPTGATIPQYFPIPHRVHVPLDRGRGCASARVAVWGFPTV